MVSEGLWIVQCSPPLLQKVWEETDIQAIRVAVNAIVPVPITRLEGPTDESKGKRTAIFCAELPPWQPSDVVTPDTACAPKPLFSDATLAVTIALQEYSMQFGASQSAGEEEVCKTGVACLPNPLP